MTRGQYETIARTLINDAWRESVGRIVEAALREPLRENPGALLLYPPTAGQINRAVETLQLIFEPPTGTLALAVPETQS